MHSWFRCVLCDLPAPLRTIEVCEQKQVENKNLLQHIEWWTSSWNIQGLKNLHKDKRIASISPPLADRILRKLIEMNGSEGKLKNMNWNIYWKSQNMG